MEKSLVEKIQQALFGDFEGTTKQLDVAIAKAKLLNAVKSSNLRLTKLYFEKVKKLTGRKPAVKPLLSETANQKIIDFLKSC